MTSTSRAAILLASFLVLLSITSCAARGVVGANRHMGPAQDSASVIEGVPFFPQDDYMCGPAAVASVVAYWGGGMDMGGAAKEIYQEKLKGTLPIDILIFAKDKGYDALAYKGSLDDLKKRIDAKTPLILFLNIGYDFYPVGHYIVATGYDENAKVVLAHSGLNKDEVMGYEDLLKSWGKTGFSTILIKPKGR